MIYNIKIMSKKKLHIQLLKSINCYNYHIESFSYNTISIIDSILNKFRLKKKNMDIKVNNIFYKKYPKCTFKYCFFIDTIINILGNKNNELLIADYNNDIHKILNILNNNYNLYLDFFLKNRLFNGGAKHLQQIYNKFIFPDIQREIERNLTKCFTITGTILNVKYNISIYFTNHHDYIKLQDIINDLLFRCYFMLLLNNNNKPNYLPIKIFLTNKNKKITDFNNIFLGVYNVNSGCTNKSNDKQYGEIIIWRQEEMGKVLIHELIHSLSYDFFHYSKHINLEITKYFDLDNVNINFFEAYTETWAVIFNCIVISIKNNNKNIEKLLKLEITFSIFQMSKILKYYGYKNYNEFYLGLNNNNNNNNSKFRQGSSIFSYYILKTILLYNINIFLSFCSKINGPKYPWIFRSSPTIFWNFIKTLLDDSLFINIINNCMESITFNNDTLKLYSLQNLRMTINEFV